MSNEPYGPRTLLGQFIHASKHRSPEETYDDSCIRYARVVASDDNDLFRKVLRLRRDMILLPAGRQQLAVGRPHSLTAMNCFFAPPIPDDTCGIFEAIRDGALTLRCGGGEGWDFSTIRPSGEIIRGLGAGALASGPVSFMQVWHTMCGTIMSAGERRGAMMGVLDIHHPDILKFVTAKRDQNNLRYFNISVAVSDEFMQALLTDGLYKLRFGGISFGDVRASDIWAVIMETNWDWAEPGILFRDRANQLNPLYYCEYLAGTNPCGEQWLPPNGACLLSAINIARLVTRNGSGYIIDEETLLEAVDTAVRANDIVIDVSNYPLPEQRAEHQRTRRMGIGPTGMANALEICGHPYASKGYLELQDQVLRNILFQAYRTSIDLARIKGSFPKFDAEKYLAGEFISKTMPDDIKDGIRQHGLRNGLLTSIAPTGTISLDADNVSGGIEPVFQIHGERDILTIDGLQSFAVTDYAANFYNVYGRTTNQVTPQEHIEVLCRAQQWIDNSISKTANVNGQIAGQGPGTTYDEFKKLYLQAWNGRAKSCTTFNLNGKRSAMMRSLTDNDQACTINPTTGERSCTD